MIYTKIFTQLDKNDAPIAGGKGASLGEMTKAGIPVPPGFVILAGTFDKFLEATDLNIEVDSIISQVKHNEIHTVEEASKVIQALIMNATVPKEIEQEIESEFAKLNTKYVAVRSSATAEDSSSAAWAGQLDSFLNTTTLDLLENVKKCWASLFTPRAIFYRFEKELDKQQISVAVVVQKMVESEVSGIAFSVHPVTEDYNQIIIEAGFGLGEAVVSGQITPDSYVLTKEPRTILDKNISIQERGIYRHPSDQGNDWQDISEDQGSTQCLTDQEILDLTDIILTIENHYGFPCDIEWAYEGQKFYIVQSRPITTLQNKQRTNTPNNEKIVFQSPEFVDFDPYGYKFFGLWKNDIFSSCFWEDCFNQDILDKLNVKMSETGSTSLAGGNFLVKNSVCDEVENQIKEKISQGDQAFFDNLKRVTDNICQEALEYGKTLKDKTISVDNVSEFFKEIRKINLLWYLGSTHFVDAAETILADVVVQEKFSAELVPYLVPQVITPLTNQQAEVLKLKKLIGNKTLAEVKQDEKIIQKMEEHVAKYSWIEILNFVGELLTVDRLYEQISHTKNIEEAPIKKDFSNISDKLRFSAECMHVCGYIKQVSPEYFCMLSAMAYPLLHGIAKELGLKYREFTMLSPEEVLSGLRGEIKPEDLRQRAIRRNDLNWFLFAKKQGASVVIENKDDIEILKQIMLPQVEKDTTKITGVVAYPGKVTGVVRIIMNRDEFDKMRPGDVLVSTMTTPDFVILMQQASAIVTDIGGLLCHAAIVSREIHKPCIIGTKFATQILHDGDEVEVDADNGVVKIIKKSSNDYLSADDFLAQAKKFTWKHWLERPYGPFVTTATFAGIDKPYFNEVGLPGFGFVANLYQFPHLYYSQESSVANLQTLQGFFQKKSIFDITLALKETDKKNERRLQEIVSSDGNYQEKLKGIREIFRTYFPFLWVIIPLEEYYQQQIIEQVPNHIKHGVEKFVGDASLPDKKNAFGEMLAMMEDDSPIKLIQQNFAWLKCRDGFSDFYTLAELKEIKVNHQKAEVKKIVIPKPLQKLFTEIKELNYFRTDRTDKFYRMMGLARPILQSIATDLKITFRELENYDVDSIINGQPRQIAKPFNYFYFNNQQAVSAKIIIDFDKNSSQEISGTIAFPGVARGKVRIVRHPSELDKVQLNDILVTQMTLPSFISAMQKAIAFVTDEGGITCHAAIIAREMKKPCIIGTKIATQILHDGDMVEVDADNGVVKIIKK